MTALSFFLAPMFIAPFPVALRPLLVTVLVLLAAERSVELWLDHRHRKRLAGRGATMHDRDGFVLILVAQASLFLLPAAEVLWAPWIGDIGVWTWIGLAGLLLAQGIRYWVIRTLGDRWTMRVITVPGAPRIRTGPYRLLPHPNYLAVFLEAIALPLTFGAWGSLVVVPMLTAVALLRRIRVEERALVAA